MTKEQLINEIADLLVANKTTFNEATQLDAFPAWDSMSKMNLLTLLSTECDLDVPFDFLAKVKTVGEIVALAKDKLEG
jgi:acyl carrier protein